MTIKKELSRKCKILLAMLGGYTLLELAIIGLNIVPKLEIAMDGEKIKHIYNSRHVFFYELNQPDNETGFMPKPDRNIWLNFGEGYSLSSLDELGFRNKYLDEEKAAIAVIGDSFTTGYSLDYEKSWSRLLENTLGEEVANYGVGGYDLWQYNTVLRQYPNFFRHRTLVYCIYSNDLLVKDASIATNFYAEEGWNVYERAKPTESDLINALTARKPTYHNTIAFKIYGLLFGVPKDSSILEGQILHRNSSGISRSITDTDLKELSDQLQVAVGIAKEYDSKMLVVYFPSKNRIYRDYYALHFKSDEVILAEDRAIEHMKFFFSEEGIPFVDLTYPLHQKERIENVRVYMKTEFHINEVGNHVAAQEIGHALLEVGSVQPTKITLSSGDITPTCTTTSRSAFTAILTTPITEP